MLAVFVARNVLDIKLQHHSGMLEAFYMAICNEWLNRDSISTRQMEASLNRQSNVLVIWNEIFVE